jgi:EmrB/QacA subfamily drug resistance transporter
MDTFGTPRPAVSTILPDTTAAVRLGASAAGAIGLPASADPAPHAVAESTAVNAIARRSNFITTSISPEAALRCIAPGSPTISPVHRTLSAGAEIRYIFCSEYSMEEDQKSIRRTALAVSCASSFMTPYLASAVNIALPSIGQEFQLNAVSLGWVTTAFLVAAAAFLLPFGKLGDMTGRKRIFLIGISLYTLFSGLAAFAPSGGILIAIVGLIGISAAMIFGTGVAILTSVYPPTERGRVLGINVAFTYAGLSLGPLFGGFLTHQFGWRSVYLMNVPFGLFAAALVVFKLKGEWLGEKGHHFDALGALLSILTLGLLIYGLSVLPAPTGFALVGGSVVGFAFFLLREQRASDPLLSLSLFRGNRAFGMSNLAALINYSATFALTFFLSLYLQYIKGLTPETAGLLLIAQPVLMVLFSPIAGRLSDRYEPRLLASVGMGIMTVMLGLLATIGEATPLVLIAVELVVVGIGYAFFSSPNTNAVMGSVDRRFYGVASATLGTMRLVGQMLSMGIAMLVLSIRVGRIAITPSVYPLFLQSLHICFAIFAALCFAGVFASLARGKREPVHQ